MAVWLVVLVLTNVATLSVLWWRHRRDEHATPELDEVFSAPRPAGVTGRSRRLITVEVLNPIELVSTRGRVAGLAGSLAPGIARRVVYDQILKTLRRELADKHVVADVRLHQLRPTTPAAAAAAAVIQPGPASPATTTEYPADDRPRVSPSTPAVTEPATLDEVTPIDLDEV